MRNPSMEKIYDITAIQDENWRRTIEYFEDIEPDQIMQNNGLAASWQARDVHHCCVGCHLSVCFDIRLDEKDQVPYGGHYTDEEAEKDFEGLYYDIAFLSWADDPDAMLMEYFGVDMSTLHKAGAGAQGYILTPNIFGNNDWRENPLDVFKKVYAQTRNVEA